MVKAQCDRLAADLVAFGRLCGAGFDGLVVCGMDALRRQPAGEAAESISRGVRAAQQAGMTATGGRQWLHKVLDIRAAIGRALDHAEPGNRLIIGCASQVSELREALSGVDCSAVDPASPDVFADEGPARELKSHHRLPGDRRAQLQACDACLRSSSTRLQSRAGRLPWQNEPRDVGGNSGRAILSPGMPWAVDAPIGRLASLGVPAGCYRARSITAALPIR